MIEQASRSGRGLFCSAMMAVASLLATAAATNASTLTLYDGGLGTLPASQGWLNHTAVGAATQTLVAGGVTLDTTASNGIAAGYSSHTPLAAVVNPSYPMLSILGGFRLDFRVGITSESHASNDRAGFSVIALDHLGQGIELGFWNDSIWAQEGDGPILFTNAEIAAYDTTVLTDYSLQVVAGSYKLFGPNGLILTGGTRSYLSFAGFPDVYAIPSFIFLGDNTTSAQANVRLENVTLTYPVPEPSTFGGMLLAAIALGAVGVRLPLQRRRQG